MFQNEFAKAEMFCIAENIFEDDEWAILEWNACYGKLANDIDRIYFECFDDSIKCVLERDLIYGPGEDFT